MLGLVCGGLGALLFLALLEGSLCGCQSTWEGPPGHHPTPKPLERWPQSQCSTGSTEITLEGGLGLCKASEKEFPRRGLEKEKIKEGK